MPFFIGSTILGLYAACLGGIAARYRRRHTAACPLHVRARNGSKIASLLLGIVLVGWFGVDVGFFAELLAQAFGSSDWIVQRLLMVVFGVLMTATAYFGFKAMYWLSAISIPPLLILAIWVAIRSLSEAGGLSGLGAQEGTGEMDVTSGVTIVVGTFAAGAVVVGNWARFARTSTQAFVVTLIAFLIGNGLMVAFGGLGGLAFDQGDFVLILYELGLVVLGVLLLIGSTWTTADNDAYGAAVAGVEIFNGTDKRRFAIGAGALGTILAVSGIYDALIPFLIWLGLVVPPIGAVLIGDWFRRWRGGIPHPSSYRFPAIRWDSSIACILGVLAGAPLSDQGSAGVPAPNGIIVSLVAVWIVASILPQEGA
ncbi:MAG: hypothetical protein U5K43_10570 [Halofilum sp. (in: g-proteobacteria)]|nr:hypothetical protein [Halofilum sp. (in: g-proteobacteria)]